MYATILAGLLAAAMTIAIPAAWNSGRAEPAQAEPIVSEEAAETAEKPALTETAQTETAQQETAQQETEQTEAAYDEETTVRLLDDGTVSTLSLHDYLIGVVLQEMPASFEAEALKAQTVAARTFTLRQIENGGAHDNADVCSDSACCQSYLTEADAAEVYGSGYAEARKTVERAVAETDGVVLTCDGALIDAVYFSSTDGSTEAAAAVWGGEVSYLQPVSSPEEAPQTETVFSLAAFRAALPEAELTGNPASWFGSITKTDGGAVAQMEIGGHLYTGTELRARFSLRSARFRTAVTEAGIAFEVTGYGHGVGMSQYGADTMAAEGSDYREILLHYYTGAALEQRQ